MRRAVHGTGTIRKKAVVCNGQEYSYWEARVTVGRNPGTGRQIQKSYTGKTQREALEKMQAAAATVATGDFFEPSRMTVGQWLNIWLADYMGDKKYSTVKHYHAQVRTHILPALGAVRLSALAPHQIQQFYNELLRSGRMSCRKDEGGVTRIQQEPLKAKSVRNIHRVLTKALSVAVSIGYLKTNPADRVTLPRAEKKEIQPLSDEQVRTLLHALGYDEYSTMFKVILFTGLREAEAIGLTWDCVDFKAGRLFIYKQLQKRPLRDGGFAFAPLKNDKTRTIEPAKYVMDVLLDWKRRQAEARLAAGDTWVGWATPEEQRTALVFTNATGSHLQPQTVYNHLKKLVRPMGAPDTRVHDLRHTYAVLSLQNGDDIKTVQGNLGHASAAFTLDVYGHVSERMRNDSAARMQRYIDSLLPPCKGKK